MTLELRHCVKSFGQPDGRVLSVLDGVDLDIGAGDVVAIIGTSGSGKSTLLNLLGMLTEPTSGEYRIDGNPTQEMAESERSRLRGSRFGFVFQDHLLLPRLDVVSNVLLPFAHGGPRSTTQRRRAHELLDRVGMADRGDAMPGELSGGQHQRVAIARALVRRPAVILADEPTGSLDIETANQVLTLLLQMAAEEKATLVLATHSPEVAALASRMLQVRAGAISELRTP